MSMPPGASAKTKAFVLLGALSLAVGARAQQSTELETIDVIGTPLGSKLDTDRVAANVQTATAKDLRERGALDLADFMKLSLGSVFVNDVQSNPLQPDVQYRGFVGSQSIRTVYASTSPSATP
jgi:iron complex outermembrane receptor protein